VTAMAIRGDTLFAGGSFGIQWSVDQGETWTDPGTTEVTNNIPIRVFRTFNGNLCAGGDGFFVWNDLTRHWTKLADNIQGFMEDCTSLGDSLYSAADLSLVKFSGDSGKTWTLKSIGIPPSNVVVNSVLTQGTTLFASVQYIGTGAPPPNTAGVWRSVDTAATWTFSGNGLPANVLVNNLIGRLNLDFYLGTQNHGLYHSFDGLSWTHETAIDTVGDVSVYGIPGAIVAAVNGVDLLVSQNSQPWNSNARGSLFAPLVKLNGRR